MEFRSSLSYPTYEDWLRSDLRKKFVTWFADLTTLQNARVFLLNTNSVPSVRDLSGYFQFVRTVFYRIRHGETALIQTDVDQFKGWGFKGRVLSSLALLQGMVVEA